MKIAACVILYNPDASIRENISSYTNHVDKIYIIDNSQTPTFKEFFPSADNSKTNFIHDGYNSGIAMRLNLACEMAIKENYEYLLTMDQDSFFDEAAISNYLKCLDQFPDKSQVSMFGVNYESSSLNADCSYKKVKHLITSGSIINLSVYKNLGGFDEKLFIDLVDTEYCLKSILKGYAIIGYQNIFLNHNLGESIEKRSLMTFKKTKRSFHSELRLYYMMRNFLYINKKYKSHFKEQIKIYKTDLINRVKNKLLYTPNRLKTLQYLFKAYKDYRNNKMGKQF